jgi:drug/metabolite transporter (DMT)-like permease
LLEVVIQLLWSVTPSASYVVLQHFAPEVYIALRFAVSGAAFLTFALLRGPRPRVRAGDWPRLILLGVLTYGVASLGACLGVKWGGVLTMSLAGGANAVLTSLLAALVLSERVGRGLLFAGVLSVCGSILLAWGKSDLATTNIAFGVMFVVWGGFLCEALGFVFSRHFTARYPLPFYLGVLQLSGACAMAVVAAVSHHGLPPLVALPASVYASFAYVTVISCGLCYTCHYWLLRHIDGHRLAFFDGVHTLGASLLGVALFGDPFNSRMLLGGGLLVGAIYAVNAGRR